MTETAELNSKVEALSQNVTNQFEGVRSEIKELTSAFRDLIRIEAEIKNIEMLVTRVCREVDDHETRMRALETSSTVNSVKIGAGERLYWGLALVGFNILTAVSVYMVTK